jgi:hypothetical protein
LPNGKRRKYNIYAKAKEKGEKKSSKMGAEKKVEIQQLKRQNKRAEI